MRKVFYVFYTVIGILVSEFYPESWGQAGLEDTSHYSLVF